MEAPIPSVTARLPLHCEQDEERDFWATDGPESGVFPDVQEKYNEIARYFEYQGGIERTLAASVPSDKREDTGSSCAQIWRIYCRPLCQLDLLNSVVASSDELQDVVSLFVPPLGDDCVYVEACNLYASEWELFLASSKAVARRNDTTPCFELIGRCDLDTVRLRYDPSQPGFGDWVVIGGDGLYAGDIALVLIPGYRYVVLVVPRIQADKGMELDQHSPCTTRPPPRLLYAAPSGCPNLTFSGSRAYECGLLFIELDPRFVSLTDAMPSHLISEFKRSNHPYITGENCVEMPHPSEWVFEPEDRVILLDRNSSGTVKTIASHLDVEMDDETGVYSARWDQVVKLFSPGDFVEVASGPERGRRLFVRLTEGSQVQLTPSSSKFLPLKIHANQLLLLPHELKATAHESMDTDPARINMTKKKVVVIRGKYKGFFGTVEQDDRDENVRVSLDTYNPAHPWRQILVPRLCCDLTTHNSWFMAEEKNRVRATSIPRALTPVPSSPSSDPTDPAWDPLLPAPERSTTPPTNPVLSGTNHAPTDLATPNQWLLNDSLCDIPMRAIIGTRDHCVYVRKREGKLLVVRTHYKVLKEVPLSDMRFVLPGKRDYGRFLVIRGVHCGRHVRSIAWAEGTNELLWDVVLVEVRSE